MGCDEQHWHIVASNTSIINSASGALGTATQVTDSFYEFTATGSLTLPKYPENGCVYTIKNKSSATVTINANTTGVSQTIGTTTSTAFLLYAQEDYVVLRYSLADTTWYVVATNGPVVSSNQTAQTVASTVEAWTAIGNGLTLGTLGPGVYDLAMDVGVQTPANASLGVGIGSGTTLISNPGGATVPLAGNPETLGVHLMKRNYVLTSSATIQGIYYFSGVSGVIVYSSLYYVGVITARRIG